MAATLKTTRNEVCWKCNWFDPDDPDTVRSGKCRWRPPIVEASLAVLVPITDATKEFCGQWFLTLYTLKDPPGDS